MRSYMEKALTKTEVVSGLYSDDAALPCMLYDLFDLSGDRLVIALEATIAGDSGKYLLLHLRMQGATSQALYGVQKVLHLRGRRLYRC